MEDPPPRSCWVCDDLADSDEHRHKRSDLVARYGKSWTPGQQPFVICGEGSSRWTRIQGPNDKKSLYEKMLCRRCNNARMKPFDQAYQQFSNWVLTTGPALHSKGTIDFGEIYGGDYVKQSRNLLRYFVKTLGCRIVADGIEPPKSLVQSIADSRRNDVKPLVVTFSINEFWYRIDPRGRIIGDDHFNTWPQFPDRPRFSWVMTLGYLDIFHWYDLEWEDGYFSGGEPMSESRLTVAIGRHDPLPGEPRASMD